MPGSRRQRQSIIVFLYTKTRSLSSSNTACLSCLFPTSQEEEDKIADETPEGVDGFGAAGRCPWPRNVVLDSPFDFAQDRSLPAGLKCEPPNKKARPGRNRSGSTSKRSKKLSSNVSLPVGVLHNTRLNPCKEPDLKFIDFYVNIRAQSATF